MKSFKPILFSTDMVQAILEGRKTQTRRIIKSQPVARKNGMYTYQNKKASIVGYVENISDEFLGMGSMGPIKKGDILWVRETFRKAHHYGFEDEFFQYKDESTSTHCEIIDKDQILHDDKWKPSIHMPKAACRIFLEVTNVRVERLQDISEDDIISEGIFIDEADLPEKSKWTPELVLNIALLKEWKSLWESINGKNSWEANPWVWVYDFKRVEKPEGFLTETPQPTTQNR